MRVAIDMRSVVRLRTGIGEYAQELVDGLLRLTSPTVELLLLGSAGAPLMTRTEAGSRLQHERFAGKNALQRAAWEHFALARHLEQRGVDVFHNPEPLLPLRPLRCASVVTVPDTTPFDAPEWYRGIIGRRYRYRARRSIETAEVVIAISEAVRQDVLRLFRVHPERVVTIHLAAGSRFRPQRDEAAFARLREAFPAPFILCVAGIEPRKNQARLIQAFDRIASRMPALELVLAGRAGWLNGDAHQAAHAAAARARIRFVDYVPDQDLAQLYRMALLLAYPSLNEGFGLPALEAMASGVPVLTSDRSALPEVAGDAAVLVDPENIDAIADGLALLLADADLRRELIRRGLERASLFDWDKTSVRTMEAYQRAIDSRRVRRSRRRWSPDRW